MKRQDCSTRRIGLEEHRGRAKQRTNLTRTRERDRGLILKEEPHCEDRKDCLTRRTHCKEHCGRDKGQI